MDGSMIVAGVAAGAAIFAAVLTYRASSRTNRVSERKVDQEAYDLAIRWRDEQLNRITAQADRLSLQVDKISSQLASEQDVSNALRNQVRTLQQQVNTLLQLVEDQKARNSGRPGHPLPGITS